jgi:hypothetical protein
MQDDPQQCQHVLKRAPELITDVVGDSYLLFECQVCGCGIVLKLDTEDQVTREFRVAVSERKRA